MLSRNTRKIRKRQLVDEATQGQECDGIEGDAPALEAKGKQLVVQKCYGSQGRPTRVATPSSSPEQNSTDNLEWTPG